MSAKRITISVPEEVVAKANRAVEGGLAESVSAYFAQLAAREPDWAEAQAVVDEWLADQGQPTREDVVWARTVLGMEDADSTDAA